MGHTHTSIAGHVRAAHALRRIAAAHHRKASIEHASWCSLRAPALDAREPSLAARPSARFMRAIARCAPAFPARELALIARGSSMRAGARCARAIDAVRSARGTRACARCARGSACLREAVRAVAQHACCPHATARALLSPLPTRPLLTAHDTRQGCCLVLVHHALARCIRTAWATSSLARRRMPALYNTP